MNAWKETYAWVFISVLFAASVCVWGDGNTLKFSDKMNGNYVYVPEQCGLVTVIKRFVSTFSERMLRLCKVKNVSEKYDNISLKIIFPLFCKRVNCLYRLNFQGSRRSFYDTSSGLSSIYKPCS